MAIFNLSDKTKKVLKVTSGCCIGVGVVGFILLAGSETDVNTIVSAGVALAGALVSFFTSLFN